MHLKSWFEPKNLSFVLIGYDMFTKRPFGHRNKTIRQKWLVITAAFGHLEPVSRGQGVDDLSDPSYLIHPPPSQRLAGLG